ncbi:unnamed protein product [Anisakis simplex]|uniref:Histone acetyltransferase n=1 Tax=Anisakis simplex TaxID=6269 RepID=A0A0M3K002_ANISI|nr:unnamed protein product [Anisakis simplex]
MVQEKDVFELKPGDMCLVRQSVSGTKTVPHRNALIIDVRREQPPPQEGTTADTTHHPNPHHHHHQPQQQSAQQSPVEYYVHYEGSDRRMDEWVDASRVRFASFAQHKNTEREENRRKITRNQKRRYDEMVNGCGTSSSSSYGIAANIDALTAALEKEHEEVTKVKHIERIRYGKYEIDTWYFSPYPDEYGKSRMLFICDYCMKYMKHERTYRTHLHECKRRKPPGEEIYRDKTLAVFEVNGRENKVYCQCLCLLAKLFLDHKTLYFDVEPFLFYILCELVDNGAHLVGFFSKERSSPDGNNLACICILPPFQQRGYGKFLIQLSYELSKREGLIGSPEKPLSDLGILGYRSYWSWVVFDALDRGNKVTISDLSRTTGIHSDDIIDTLNALGLTRNWCGQQTMYITRKLVDFRKRNGLIKKPKLLLKPRLLRWHPPRHETPDI